MVMSKGSSLDANNKSETMNAINNLTDEISVNVQLNTYEELKICDTNPILVEVN